jgi:hypothetical protein|nr:MAG TPA: hypothetical protein [Caudoviricetes sp.]
MQKLIYISALSCLFAGIQSANLATLVLTFLVAYVLIEAADTM